MSPRSPSPLSEGEIVSGDEEKAISTSTNTARNSKVNMSARHLSGSSSRAARLGGMEASAKGYENEAKRASPYTRDRSRSRSPYRASKPANGDKRRHEDDHYSRKTVSDPRRFKVHYEKETRSRDTEEKSRHRYADLDEVEAVKSALSHNAQQQRGDRESTYTLDRTRARDQDRSRSPFRHSKVEPAPEAVGIATNGQKVSNASNVAHDESESIPQQVSKLKMSLTQRADNRNLSSTNQRLDSTSQPGLHQANGLFLSMSGTIDEQASEQKDGTAEQVTLTEAELIEQRRKRREAIKARHNTSVPLLVQALEHTQTSAPSTPHHDSSGGQSQQHSPPSSIGSPGTPHRDSPPGSPAAFTVTDDEELADRRNADGDSNNDDGPSAADYDPNLDMQEDRPNHRRQDLQDASVAGVHAQTVVELAVAAKKPVELDMFADDDDDDMFAPADSAAQPAAVATKQAKALDESLLDNWDYPDGHYRIILGELLDGRYAVQQQIGKGTFATVVRALDTRTGTPVAVKIACNNQTMYKAGQKEMEMLEILNSADSEDKKHIIRLLRPFEHKGHLCLVFENLSADLREVLKKFGRNVGLNLKAIRSYAQQMMLALSHLKKCQILHADLKPDNILVSEKRNLLKICDLGTASFAEDAEVTPYLVSRFYRAPEVILGMPFDYAIDMWAIGCTLYELYTGRILFAGADNNQMLRAIQECRGKFPMRMLKKSTLAEKHFDFDGNFFSQERDKITGKATMRQLNFNKTSSGKDLRARLSSTVKGMKADEIKEHASFVDLMEKCLQLDPARRVSPNEALRHSFITHGTTVQHTEKPAVKVAMKVPRMK